MDTIMKTEEDTEEELKPLSIKTEETTSPLPLPSFPTTSEQTIPSSITPTESEIKPEIQEEPKEAFKTPLPPLLPKPLPADIARIISLGLNEPDPLDLLPCLTTKGGGGGTSNYEEVVRALKESSGFLISSESSGVGGKGEGLKEIEEEMRVGGVFRGGVGGEKGGEKDDLMEGVQKGEGEVVDLNTIIRPSTSTSSESSSSSSDSSSESDSSSSDSDDSEELAARLIPANLRIRPSTSSTTTPSTSTTTAATGKLSKNARKRQSKKAASASAVIEGGNESDLSEDDVNLSSTAPKTEHEIISPLIEPPTLSYLPEGNKLIKFGEILSVIDSVVVIKAITKGDWRVLDMGSLCCWEDRKVVGNIFETFGSVIQPFYSIRFPPSSSLPDPNEYTIGKSIYYSENLVSFIFTKDLRGLKGSDASNVWDEEIGQAEMEWSDDELELEFKRNLKNDRRSRTASMTPGPSSSTINRNQTPSSSTSRQNSRAPSSRSRSSSLIPSSSSHNLPPRPTNSLSALPYDDDVYTPLQRPRDLHSMNQSSSSSASSSSKSLHTPLTTSALNGGRKMFERNNITGAEGNGNNEFEFSDNDDEEAETGSISSTFEVDERYRAMDELDRENEEIERRNRMESINSTSNSGAGASRGGRGNRGNNRGGGNERGRGNNNNNRGRGGRGGNSSSEGGGGESFRGGRGGRGRGNDERGGRGRGNNNDRGSNRGGRGGGGGSNDNFSSRPVAPLPSRPIGLPSKPAFSDSSTLSTDGLSRSMNTITSPSSSTSSSNLPPLSSQTRILPPPPPPPGGQLPNSMYQFNPSGFQSNFNFNSPQQQLQQQQSSSPFPQFPFYQPSFPISQIPINPLAGGNGGAGGMTGPIPMQGGHFNPRFLANVAASAGGGILPPPLSNLTNPYFQQPSYQQSYSPYPQPQQHQQQSSYQQNYQSGNSSSHNRQGSWNGNNSLNPQQHQQQQYQQQNQQQQHQNGRNGSGSGSGGGSGTQ